MRHSSHLLRSIPFSISANSHQTPSSICTSCLHLLSIPRNGAPSSRSKIRSQRRHASNSEWIEGARRRIWGTKEGEAPPGPEDPYGGESILETRRRIRRQAMEGHPEGNPLLERRRREREDLGLEIVEDGAKWTGQSDAVRTETKSEREDVEYRPALTWDGLEHVGITGKWWEIPVVEGETVVPYMRRPKLTSRQDLLCALHRAVVEVSTLQAAEMKLTYSSRPDMPNSTEMADLIRQVEVKVKEGEKSEMRIELSYPNNEAKRLILEGMKAVEKAEPKLDGPKEVFKDSAEAKGQVEDLERDIYPTDEQADGQEALTNANAMPEEAAILDELERSVKEEKSPGSSPIALTTATPAPRRNPLDESFLTFPLTDPKVKFAILKRVIQLSSNLIPDYALPRITTLSLLLDQLLNISTLKAKSVYEVLTSSLPSSSQSPNPTFLPNTARLPNPNTNLLKGMKIPPLAHLPNVKIHAKRQTPIDRQMEVGRWKIIEAELRKRGLPVTGHRVDGHVVGMRFGNGRRGVEY